MKENLQAKEKELDLWIEEYNKQLEEKSIEGKAVSYTHLEDRIWHGGFCCDGYASPVFCR